MLGHSRKYLGRAFPARISAVLPDRTRSPRQRFERICTEPLCLGWNAPNQRRSFFFEHAEGERLGDEKLDAVAIVRQVADRQVLTDRELVVSTARGEQDGAFLER